MEKLVTCEARSLVVGSCFCVIDSLEEITCMKASDDTQSGTVACSCQGAWKKALKRCQEDEHSMLVTLTQYYNA